MWIIHPLSTWNFAFAETDPIPTNLSIPPIHSLAHLCSLSLSLEQDSKRVDQLHSWPAPSSAHDAPSSVDSTLGTLRDVGRTFLGVLWIPEGLGTGWWPRQLSLPFFLVSFFAFSVLGICSWNSIFLCLVFVFGESRFSRCQQGLIFFLFW